MDWKTVLSVFLISSLILSPVHALNQTSSSSTVPDLISDDEATTTTSLDHEGHDTHSSSLTDSTTIISNNQRIGDDVTRNPVTERSPMTTTSRLVSTPDSIVVVPSTEDTEEDNDDKDSPSRRMDSADVLDDSLKNKCVMKDSCTMKQNILGDVSVPCFERHDPHPVDDSEALDTLRRICPSLFKDGEADPLVCCNPGQIYEMETSFQFPAQLGLSRCPACSYNFRVSLCEMTCSPKQGDFIRVLNTSLAEDGVRQQIDHIEYHLDASFPDKLYESCKGVQGLAPGQMLLDLMCGPWGSKECDGRKWLQFVGESVDDNGQSPFAVTHIFHEKQNKKQSSSPSFSERQEGKEVIPLSPTNFACWQKPSFKELACSCNDCEETCRRRQLPSEAKFLPSDPESMQVMGMTGAIFSSLLMFLFLVSLILTYFLMNAYQKKRTQNRKFFFNALFFQ